MEVNATTEPKTYEVTMKVSEKELNDILIVLRNAPNRTRYYHQSADAFYNALVEATGVKTGATLPPLHRPEPFTDFKWDYGSRYRY